MLESSYEYKQKNITTTTTTNGNGSYVDSVVQYPAFPLIHNVYLSR